MKNKGFGKGSKHSESGKQNMRERFSGHHAFSVDKKIKQNAVFSVNKLIKKFKILRGSCAVCREKDNRINAHHKNYNNPYKIVWLCSSHHSQVHLGYISDRKFKSIDLLKLTK